MKLLTRIVSVACALTLSACAEDLGGSEISGADQSIRSTRTQCTGTSDNQNCTLHVVAELEAPLASDAAYETKCAEISASLVQKEEDKCEENEKSSRFQPRTRGPINKISCAFDSTEGGLLKAVTLSQGTSAASGDGPGSSHCEEDGVECKVTQSSCKASEIEVHVIDSKGKLGPTQLAQICHAKTFPGPSLRKYSCAVTQGEGAEKKVYAKGSYKISGKVVDEEESENEEESPEEAKLPEPSETEDTKTDPDNTKKDKDPANESIF